MRVGLKVILSTRTAIEVSDLLSMLFTHNCAVSFAEVSGASDASACRYCRTKDVIILAVVVAKHKFIQVQGQVLVTDVVVGADDAALQQRPEVFNVVGMDASANILVIVMANNTMSVAVPNPVVTFVLIGGNQVHFLADSLFHESIKSVAVGVLNDFTVLRRNLAKTAF
jgi:hypothetical protein